MSKRIILFFFILLIVLFFTSIFFLDTRNVIKVNKNTSWTITQYGENTMPQMMCFTIEGNENGLVIVDGGYEDSNEDINRLLDVAKKHNNIVDVWIITHLDSDHVGAFLSIINNHPEITVKRIYTTNVPTLEQAKEKYPKKTRWEQYEEFMNLNLDNIHFLYENDATENLIGLRMQVLWAYSNWVYDNESNLLNNGSLVFKLYGKEESMLFCADTQSQKVEQEIIKKHKYDLKSDYLQVGHHGNNYFSNEFYKIVSPKIAFFAGPKELVENTNKISWYTADIVKKWLEEDNVKVYCHETSPNVIVLK